MTSQTTQPNNNSIHATAYDKPLSLLVSPMIESASPGVNAVKINQREVIFSALQNIINLDTDANQLQESLFLLVEQVNLAISALSTVRRIIQSVDAEISRARIAHSHQLTMHDF